VPAAAGLVADLVDNREIGDAESLGIFEATSGSATLVDQHHQRSDRQGARATIAHKILAADIIGLQEERLLKIFLEFAILKCRSIKVAYGGTSRSSRH
jgi:hypothetical protein